MNKIALLRWYTILNFFSELDKEKWYTAETISELYYLDYQRAYYHLNNLSKFGSLSRRKVEGHSTLQYEFKLTKKGEVDILKLSESNRSENTGKCRYCGK